MKRGNLERSVSLPRPVDVERECALVRSSSFLSDSVIAGRKPVIRAGKRFPPPLESHTRRATQLCAGQLQRGVQLHCIRQQGRVILQEVRAATELMSLQPIRSRGRLVINLVRHSAATAAPPPPPPLPQPPPPPPRSLVPRRLLPREGLAPACPCPREGCFIPEEINEADKLKVARTDHAHLLRELAAAYANRRARINKLFPCKRDEAMWEQQRHIHCVTTSS